jgi:hypothetical protein
VKSSQKWVAEFEGVQVLAVASVRGYHLSLSDPDWQLGVVSQHDEPTPDLDVAMTIARAMIEKHLRVNRRKTANLRELFQVAWKRVP